ncbi:hypothetical protein [Streptomyces sp. CA-106110]
MTAPNPDAALAEVDGRLGGEGDPAPDALGTALLLLAQVAYARKG